MPTPVDWRRWDAIQKHIETALRDGYAPINEAGGKGSAVERAKQTLKADGYTLGAGSMAKWLEVQNRRAEQGREHRLPDWSLYRRPKIVPVGRGGAVRSVLLTAAQNDCDIHQPFWRNLQAYADFLDAEIMVGQFTYQVRYVEDRARGGEARLHRTRAQTWHPALKDHLVQEAREIGPVLFAAEVNTLPTNGSPIAGFETYGRGRTCIFAHAKQQLTAVATMPGHAVPLAMTTGCVTLEDYTDTRAGQKAQFHHTFGAVLVEIDAAGTAHIRRISATRDGSFQDLDRVVRGGKVSTGHRVEAVVFGDIQSPFLDPGVALATWGFDVETWSRIGDGLVDALKPAYGFFHDLVDFKSISHHERKKLGERFRTYVKGHHLVEQDLRLGKRFLRAATRDFCRSVVVGSNHDCLSMDTEALTRRGWLSFDDIKPDDQVLSLDPHTGAAVWAPITAKGKRANNEGMISVRGSAVDMLVTPRHRVLHRRRTGNVWGDAWLYAEAQSLPSRFAVPVAAPSLRPEYPISDEWLTIAGWLLTDGHIAHGARGRPRVSFSQSKPSPGLDAALQVIGAAPTVSVNQPTATEICGRQLKSAPLPNRQYRCSADDSERILQIVPERGRLPDWAFDLSDRQFAVLLDALVAGNGTWDGGDPAAKQCAALHGLLPILSSVQACAVAHGWRAHIKIVREKHYVLNLCRKTSWEGDRHVVVSPAAAVDEVWCLQTPLTNFMVRRNGKPFFTGNCWLERWLDDPTNAKELHNALAFHRFNLARYEAIAAGDEAFDAFWHSLKAADDEPLEGVEFAPYGRSFVICPNEGGIECGNHGDLGANGSRGSVRGLAKVATRIITGDGHSPGTFDGHDRAGTSSLLDLGYNRGPSSWVHAHIIVYPNSRRTHLFIQNGKWRA